MANCDLIGSESDLKSGHQLLLRSFAEHHRQTVGMTIHFSESESSDGLLSKSVSSTRLRAWLNLRLRHLDSAKRIKKARVLRSEFFVSSAGKS